MIDPINLVHIWLHIFPLVSNTVANNIANYTLALKTIRLQCKLQTLHCKQGLFAYGLHGVLNKLKTGRQKNKTYLQTISNYSLVCWRWLDICWSNLSSNLMSTMLFAKYGKILPANCTYYLHLVLPLLLSNKFSFSHPFWIDKNCVFVFTY